MNTERQQLRNVTPDYSRDNVKLTMLDPTRTTQNGRGEQVQYRQFAIEVDRSYSENGQTIEKQPLAMFCTTWDADAIALLSNVQLGDMLSIKGFLEPAARVYITDGTKEGDRGVIPDNGSAPGTTKKGVALQPTAHPYRLDGQHPGVFVVPTHTLNVIQLVVATQLRAAGEVADATNAFAELQNQQGSLNEATADGAGAEAQNGQQSQNDQQGAPNPMQGTGHVFGQ